MGIVAGNGESPEPSGWGFLGLDIENLDASSYRDVGGFCDGLG